MTLDQIKDIFGVDLTTAGKPKINTYLQNIYINTQWPENTITKIARQLDKNHASVIHSLKHTDKYSKRKEYKLLKIAFDKKDESIFKEVDYMLKNVKYGRSKKQPVKRIVLKSLPKERWHSTKIKQALNKDQKHRLWDIPMPEYTLTDYRILKELLRQPNKSA